jgi:hypothetical protein
VQVEGQTCTGLKSTTSSHPSEGLCKGLGRTGSFTADRCLRVLLLRNQENCATVTRGIVVGLLDLTLFARACEAGLDTQRSLTQASNGFGHRAEPGRVERPGCARPHSYGSSIGRKRKDARKMTRRLFDPRGELETLRPV